MERTSPNWPNKYRVPAAWPAGDPRKNLNEGQFFHGTLEDFQPGDILEGQGNTLHGPSTGRHVYITSEDMAGEYAAMANEEMADHGDLDPDVHAQRVYEVRPLAPVEVDPAGIELLDDDDNPYTDDRRTLRAKVVRKVSEEPLEDW